MTAAPLRTRQLSAIHAGRKQIGLDDDVYRSLVSRFSKQRTESSGEMTDRERAALLEHFKLLGAGRPKSSRNRDPRDFGPQALKLRALWISASQLGEIDNPDDAALKEWARKQFKIDDFSWANGDHLRRGIEGLKAICARAGYFPGVGSPEQLATLLLAAQWERLYQRGAVRLREIDALESWADGWQVKAKRPRRAGLDHYELDELRDLNAALGRWIKQAKKKAEARDG